MNYLYFLLLDSYAGLTLLANFSQRKKQPYWLPILTFLGALAVFLAPKSGFLLLIGLGILCLTALLNGALVFGTIHPRHHLIRLGLSLLFVYLGFRAHFLK